MTGIPEPMLTLIYKRLNDVVLTPDEEAALAAWMAVGEENRRLYNKMMDPHSLMAGFQEYYDVVEQIDPAGGRPSFFVPNSARQRLSIRYLFRYTAVAAITTLSITAATWFFFLRKTALPSDHPNTLVVTDRQPANQGATLLVGDKKIDLTQLSAGAVSLDKTKVARKLADGSLTYKDITGAAAGQLHTMITPRGGFYQVLLSDGTKVWLNAATTLSYPAQFTGPERKIHLIKGEAYLEVAHRPAQPFLVVHNDIAVKVIGTHFNVKQYDSYPLSTTLLQGAVKVTGIGAENVTLKPGEQATVSPSGKLSVRQVDAMAMVAWKNGVFSFADASLKEVTDELSRWYDVDFVFDDKLGQTGAFEGSFERSLPLSGILKKLEFVIGNIHFTILENRQVKVSHTL